MDPLKVTLCTFDDVTSGGSDHRVADGGPTAAGSSLMQGRFSCVVLPPSACVPPHNPVQIPVGPPRGPAPTVESPHVLPAVPAHFLSASSSSKALLTFSPILPSPPSQPTDGNISSTSNIGMRFSVGTSSTVMGESMTQLHRHTSALDPTHSEPTKRCGGGGGSAAAMAPLPPPAATTSSSSSSKAPPPHLYPPSLVVIPMSQPPALQPQQPQSPTGATTTVSFLSRRRPTKYLKLSVLGEGGCGVVYAVERTSDGKRLAAKVVLLSATNEIQKRNALEEPRWMAACGDSPFIVKYYEHWTDNKKAIITIMEYVDGVDMCSHIRTRHQRRNYHLMQVRRLAHGLPENTQHPEEGMDNLDVSPLSDSRLRMLEQKIPHIRPHVEQAQAAAITETAALVLFLQALLALQHVHSRGIVHRDVTAGNLFLCRTGLIKFGDFGLSAPSLNLSPTGSRSSMSGVGFSLSNSLGASINVVASGSTNTVPSTSVTATDHHHHVSHSNSPPPMGSPVVAMAASSSNSDRGTVPSPSPPFLVPGAVGTPSYMAPELWCTHEMPPYSAKSDMWALGVVLFELLCGRRPFFRENHSRTGAAILSGVIPDITKYVANLHVQTIDLMHSLLEYDPERRPTAQAVLQTPIMQRTLVMLISLLKEDPTIDQELIRCAVADCERYLAC